VGNTGFTVVFLIFPMAGCAAPRVSAGLNPDSVESVSAHMRLPPALTHLRPRFARKVVRARRILAAFASSHGWSAQMRKPFFRGVEIFAKQARLWRRVLKLNGLPLTTRLPASGLAAGIEKGVLLAVTPEEYMKIRPEYASVPGAWTRLLAHEMAHRLHVAILKGDEDAMGPRWFYEGFAVVASGDLRSPPLAAGAFWAAIAAKGRGAYRKYGAALRFLMTRIPLEKLVRRAGRRDFVRWLKTRLGKSG
jgi:hypothetical protein